MKRTITLLLLLVWPTLVAGQQGATKRPHTIAIRNVTVIDMRSATPRTYETVIIANGRITAIGKKPRIPGDAEVIDGRGKYLIPGLWDSYTYTLEAVKNHHPYFELLIAHGVTGVRDVGTSYDLAAAAKLRSEIDAGHVLGPRLFYAGNVLMSEMPPRRSDRWTGISTVVKTVEDAKHAVAELARSGVDHIKTEKRTRPDILRAIIEEAHKQKLPVVGVPPSFLIDASNDGLDCIEHFAEINRETSDKREEYYALYRDRKIDTLTTDQNYAFFGTMTRDRPYYDLSLRTLSKNKTCAVTNAASTATFSGDFEMADKSRLRFKTESQRAEVVAAIAERERQIRNNDYRTSTENRKRALQDILDIRRAGVMLLAGTQLNQGAIGTAGLMLHDELSILVQAGLSPFEALQTATINPARFMRREKDLGTIEVGKIADIIMLDGNPLADISNTRKINAVIVGGRILDRNDLDKILAAVEAAAKSVKGN
ncbi:MAG: hypothetical protein DMF63_10290 [Acidobacteria bacterium]|nr:MAG: hypothetical protein DMF63_10290 [Acidobacteriota bacterium]